MVFHVKKKKHPQMFLNILKFIFVSVKLNKVASRTGRTGPPELIQTRHQLHWLNLRFCQVLKLEPAEMGPAQIPVKLI